MILTVFVYRPPAATTAVDVTVEVEAYDAITATVKEKIVSRVMRRNLMYR
jgi:hypothetical protein